MAGTYAILAKGADAVLLLATDTTCPPGCWLAVAVVSGIRRTYLLRGKMSSEQSQIVGRIDESGTDRTIFCWPHILGGHPEPVAFSSERSAFTLMTQRH